MTPRRTASSTLALAAATLFLALAALTSFLGDDAGALGRAWSLRGTLVPSARAEER